MARTVAVILLTVLFSSGCASHRKSVTTAGQGQLSAANRTDSELRLALDSASEIVEVRTGPLTVPKSQVCLMIATDSLRRLPAGAGYMGRSGQASVEVTRIAATPTEPEYIYVNATCDSLQLLCNRYERTIRNLRRDYGELSSGMESLYAESNQTRETEKTSNGIATAFKWLFFGLSTGLVGIIIILIKKTRK